MKLNLRALLALFIAVILIGSVVSQTGIAFATPVKANPLVKHNPSLHSIKSVKTAHAAEPTKAAVSAKKLSTRLVTGVTTSTTPITHKTIKDVKQLRADLKAKLNQFVPNTILVTYKDTATSSDIATSTSSVSAKSVSHVASFKTNSHSINIKKLVFATKQQADAAIAKLKSDPSVKSVSQERIFHVSPFTVKSISDMKFKQVSGSSFDIKSVTADPVRKYQWYLPKIGDDISPVAAAHIEIALLDTGVDYNHPDLSGQIIQGHDYVNSDADPMDDNGHGTMVAGIITAKTNNGLGVAGISANSKVLAIKVCDAGGSCPESDVFSGLADAAADPNVRIVSMSLGGTTPATGSADDEGDYAAWQSAVDAVTSQGKLVVAAAGNDANLDTFFQDNLSTPGYDYLDVPSTLSGVISVASTDKNDARSSFSNYATNSSKAMSDIAAPGEDIVSTACGDIEEGACVSHTYDSGTGTSFSTPIVAASLARVWSQQAVTTSTATSVLGHTDFTSYGGATAVKVNGPTFTAFDSAGNLWVSDSNNNRILKYPAASLAANGAAATVALGQTSLSATGSGTSPTTLSFPRGIAFDSTGNLWVADSDNNRVLEYPVASLVTGGAATVVIGQTSGFTRDYNTSPTNLANPSSLTFDSTGNLWVADKDNNRVLEYPKANLVTGGAATVALGQTNLLNSDSGFSATQLDGPFDLKFNSTGHLFVSDKYNNRVLIFKPVNLVTGGAATQSLGNCLSVCIFADGATATNLNSPRGLAIDSSGSLWVADASYNRVLKYPKANQVTGGAATIVLGQADFTHSSSNRGGSVAANTLSGPWSVKFDSAGNLWVADNNNARVLKYPVANLVTGGAATIAVGQTTLTSNSDTSAAALDNPNSSTYDSAGNLWVADNNDNRVLKYPKASLGTPGAPATVVLGQANFATSGSGTSATTLSCPTGLAFDSSGNLWVADNCNNRVLKFPAANLVTGGAATVALGQTDLVSGGSDTSATALDGPHRVAFNSTGFLFVTDTLNNRVMAYPPSHLVTGGAATGVVGQTDFASSDNDHTATTLYQPVGLTFDSSGDLWVADGHNNRVVQYLKTDLSANTFGAPASVALGQSSLTGNSCPDTSATSLCSPVDVKFDSAGNLWVADNFNYRVLMYPSANQVTGGAATLVIGQLDLTSDNCGTSATTLCYPHGVAFDSTGNMAITDSDNNRVLIYPKASLVTNPGAVVSATLLKTGVQIPKDYGFPTNNLPVTDPHYFSVNRTDIAAALGVSSTTRTGIQGQVWAADYAEPLYGASVTITGPVTKSVQSNAQGFYTFTNLPAGTYSVKAAASGYYGSTDAGVVVTAGKMTQSSIQDNFFMPTVKPAGVSTIVTYWNFESTGIDEMAYSTGSSSIEDLGCCYGGFEHPDMLPYNLAAGVGGGVNGYLRVTSDHTMASLFTENPGGPSDPRYLSSSYETGVPVEVFSYKPTSGASYAYSISDNPYGLGWGSMSKLKAITKVYTSTGAINSIDDSAATGTADYWNKVFTQAGISSVSTLNKRAPEFGTITSASPQAVLVDDGISTTLDTPELDFSDSDYGSFFDGTNDDYNMYYEDLLNATYGGYGPNPITFNEWNTLVAGPPTAGDLGAINKPIVWFTGDDYADGMKTNERNAISSLESTGHKLYITGQYIAENLAYTNTSPEDQSEFPYTFPNPGPQGFLNNVLGADFVGEDCGPCGYPQDAPNMLGIDTSPISDPFTPTVGTPGDELALYLGEDGDSAENQSYVDVITPHIGTLAVSDWNYIDTSGNPITFGNNNFESAGVHYASGTNKVVFQSSGLEGVDGPDMRSQVLQDVLSFFGP